MRRHLLPLALAALTLAALPGSSAAQQPGGPIILAGIDAEDGGPGTHGPIRTWARVLNSVKGRVRNGGAGVLVIGGGKDRRAPVDDVTAWWNAVGSRSGTPITYVNGPPNIRNRSFAGFAILGIASSEDEAPVGGLTQAENNALASRRGDIASFVNGGGGLLGFSQTGFTNPYAYVARVGQVSARTGLNYDDITPTPQGRAVGIDNSLDVEYWHDEFTRFPNFLRVLATNARTGRAAAVGGSGVVVGPQPDGDGGNNNINSGVNVNNGSQTGRRA